MQKYPYFIRGEVRAIVKIGFKERQVSVLNGARDFAKNFIVVAFLDKWNGGIDLGRKAIPARIRQCPH